MWDRLADRFYRTGTGRPWLVLLVALLLTGAAGSLVQRYYFDRDYRIFFADDNPDLINFKTITDRYGPYESVVIGIHAKEGIFTRENLRILRVIDRNAWEIPNSTSVSSLANTNELVAENDSLQSRPLIPADEELTDAKIAEIRRRATTNKLTVGRLINKEGTFAAILVRCAIDFKKADHQEGETADFAHSLITDMEKRYPHLRFHSGGSIMYNAAMKSVNMREMRYLLPLMMGMLLLTLSFVMGSLRATLGVMFIVSITTATAMGLGSLVSQSLNAATATAPLIIMTITVADCVHVIKSLQYYQRRGIAYREALRCSLKSNLSPVFWTSLTTVVGFLNLNFSEIPPYASMGNIAAIGIVLGFLHSLITLPAFLTLLQVKERRERKDWILTLVEMVFPWVERHSRAIVWTFHILMLGALVSLPQMKLIDHLDKIFSKDLRIRQDTMEFSRHLEYTYELEYSLESTVPGGVFRKEYLEEVAAFTAYMLSQPEVKVAQDMTQVVRNLNRKLHNNDPAYEVIPESGRELSQYFLLYEMSLPPGVNITDLVDMGRRFSKVRFTLLADDDPEKDVVLKVADLGNQWLKQNARHIRPSEGTSLGFMMANLFQRNAKGMIIGSLFSYLLVTLGLIVMLRSLKWGIFSLIPNLSPTLLSFGAWSVMVGHVGIAASSVTILTIGIIVDDTVHFISKYHSCKKHLSRREAVRQVVVHTGHAITTTSLILISGFAVTATSDISLNATMGILVTLTIVFALLADLFYLPAIILRDTFGIAGPVAAPPAEEGMAVAEADVDEDEPDQPPGDLSAAG